MLKYGADFNITNTELNYPDHDCWLDQDVSICPVVEYVIRLRYIGYKIRNENYEHIDHNQSQRPEYEKEIHKFIKIVIAYNPKITLFDIFHMKKKRLARMTTNLILKEKIIHTYINLEKEYPIYGTILLTQIQQGINQEHQNKRVEKF